MAEEKVVVANEATSQERPQGARAPRNGRPGKPAGKRPATRGPRREEKQYDYLSGIIPIRWCREASG